MSVKIIADTSCDLEQGSSMLANVSLTPFVITIGKETFRDTEKTREELLALMEACAEPARSACPSPHDFMTLFAGEEEAVFVITISSALSGTFSSAVTAKEQYQKEHPDKEIYVIDSLSASAGESAVTHFVVHLTQASAGVSYAVMARMAQDYANALTTVFVLEDLSNLMKNGRLSKAKGLVASLLNIKPILGTDGQGEIVLVKNARGSKKAMKELFTTIQEKSHDLNVEEIDIYISHCNALERAEALRDMIEGTIPFRSIHILETNGLSTVYTANQGVVVAF